MSQTPMPDEQRWGFWYRLVARLCLVWGLAVLVLVTLNLNSTAPGVDTLQLSRSFTIAGVALLVASGARWIRLRRFAVFVAWCLVVAAMPLADFVFVFRRAAMISPAGLEDAWAHAVSILAVVLTPVLLIVASVMVSLAWVHWRALDAVLKSPSVSTDPFEVEIPWQPSVEEGEDPAWDPDPLRITIVVAATLVCAWIAAKIGIHAYRSYRIYDLIWPDVALLGSVISWPVGMAICIFDRRVRRFVRWFARPLALYTVLVFAIAGVLAMFD
ncbi:MAG: hypothetical protein NXI14_04140 [bacterium]|nr:hypothetical protein [bacterium]